MTNETAGGTSVQGLLCPVCKVNLVMTSREGVEVDYCPTCRGVWLDRGELDKIIERSVTTGYGAAPGGQPDPRGGDGYGNANSYGHYDDRYRDGGHGGGHGRDGGHDRGHGRGQGSFLRRLFD